MPDNTKESVVRWNWVMQGIAAAAYVSLIIGALQHPVENNVASFGIWSVLAIMITYSARKLMQPGWRIWRCFFIGNVAMLALAYVRGGHFDLGETETYALGGVVATFVAWSLLALRTGKSSARTILYGGVITDIASFYPQIKQYVLPHDKPTVWLMAGWGLFALGVLVNIIFIDRLFVKLRMNEGDYVWIYFKSKRTSLILEDSFANIENFIVIIITMFVMSR